MNKKTASKSIKDFISEFLDYLDIEKGLSSRTQENYSRYLSVFFAWLQENKQENLRPNEFNEDFIWKYRVYLSKKKLQKNSQKNYLIALRSLFDFFAERKIESISSSKIKLGKNIQKEKIKVFELEELKKILKSPNTMTKIGLRDRAIMETFFSTGMRISELVSLNREDIRTKEKDTFELAIKGKGSRIRSVYFSKRAMIWVLKYLNSRSDIDPALFINYKKGEDEKLNDRRLAIGSIQNIIKNYIKQAGVRINATPHTFRHTFATDLLNQDIDIRLVQEFLGHKSVSTTQIYTHISNKKLKNFHKKFHSGKKIKN